MKTFILRLIFKPSETERIYWDLFIEISSKSLYIADYPWPDFSKVAPTIPYVCIVLLA